MNKIRLFAYLNIENPMVAWEVAIGRIKNNTEPNNSFYTSIWKYNILYNYANHGLDKCIEDEFRLEYVRQQNYKDSVSRMQGLYFFDSYQTVINAFKKWDIKINEDYISEVEFNVDNISKVDSEWITHCLAQNNNTDWMEQYWLGKAHSDKPIYEYLALGSGIILNYNLRLSAYKNVMDEFPESTELLAMACCAFQVKKIDSIAIITPGLHLKDSIIYGNYFINIDDLKLKEKEVAESISQCIADKTHPPVIKPKNKDTFFHLPDLSDLKFTINNLKLNSEFVKIHKN